jgi:succinoglycan biosynthesis transport protein ExoP
MQAPFDASALSGLGIKPLASLLAHRRAAALVLAVVLAAGAPLAWIKGAPRYRATATLEVAPRYMKNLKDDKELDFQSNSQYRQFVEHQVRSVARYDIVEAALKALGPDAAALREAGESPRRSVERLQERLVVAAVPDTYLMQLSLEDPRKEKLAQVVNAVAAAYLRRMGQEQVFGTDERVGNITARETELLRAVALQVARRSAIARELGVANFGDGDGNPYDKLLLASRAALAEARHARMAAQARRQAFLGQGETDPGTRSIQESILSDPGLNSLKASLNNRRALLLSQVSGLADGHPALQAAQTELREIDAAIAAGTGRLDGEVRASLRARYAMALDQAQRYELSTEQQLAEQQQASSRFAALFNEALSLGREIDQTGKEIDALRERQNFFRAERGAPGFVHMVTPALAPEQAFGLGRKKLLLMALAAALAAALVVPVLLDLMERRVRSVNEVERALGLPAMGWLIEQDGTASTLFAQEQMRRLAAALMREQAQHGTRVFGLCGVKPGAGCSDLALGLAATLDALGWPALAVEANAFHPDARYSTALPGLAQCLAGRHLVADCIVEAAGALPARIAVGDAGGHLDRLDRLGEALAACPQRYRFILVDMPPLLLSADTEIMLGQLGHVLLVVEAGGVGRGELLRAGRLLQQTVSQAAGIIVNRVRPVGGGGYFGELLIEYLTRRKFSQFYPQGRWRFQCQQLAARWRARRRHAGQPQEKGNGNDLV